MSQNVVAIFRGHGAYPVYRLHCSSVPRLILAEKIIRGQKVDPSCILLLFARDIN